MRLLLVALSLLFTAPTYAYAACSDPVVEETRITEAITAGDKVWKFEADGLKTFIQSLQKIGFLIGDLPVAVDAIYVTSQDDNPTLTIFYVQQHCIVYVQAVRRDAIMRLLP